MASETMAEQQKKRTMEAIERRFAQAKAEIHHQQHKNKKITVTTTKTPTENKIELTSHGINSPLSPLKSIATSSAPSSKKGHISFSGHTSAQDVELNNPAYLQISHSADDNLLKITTEISGKNMTANDILHDLLQHGDSAQKYMQGSKNVKVDNWILLDNVVQKSSIATGARSQALQRQSKRSKRHMSIKQHKKFGSFDFPQESHNYDIFKPMHDKWKDYVTKLLKNIGKNLLAQSLLNGDLHGALILVVQCKIAGLIGVRGIMIRETVETFGIITEENKFQVVPKKLSVFMLQVDCWKVTLLGDKLTSRNMTT
ncbi:ribonuclease MRP protein subunit POP4-like [Solanum dulcamara]|uniref:ribonuclease MRP protein subunit POP4-like n=1 Tax=Solanum dulcamara TaxID=45834 RepID=UPI002486425E|nr:ribonuclease MRP protein subunit POP4-like [Solanum dulcamara]